MILLKFVLHPCASPQRHNTHPLAHCSKTGYVPTFKLLAAHSVLTMVQPHPPVDNGGSAFASGDVVMLLIGKLDAQAEMIKEQAEFQCVT